MGKCRSITAQLNHAVSCSFTVGSKRSARLDTNQSVSDKVYSTHRAESLHKLAKSFGKFLKQEFPEIRWAKDIQRDHVQAYLDKNSPHWSKRTSEEYCSQFRKLEAIVQRQYDRKASFAKDLVSKQIDTTDYRNRAMDKEDFLQLRQSFSDKSSHAKQGIELSYRFGLRSCEVVGLRAEEIDLEKNVLHLGDYCKNGKHRDVPIRPKDLAYIKDIKELVGNGRVCPIREESLNSAVRCHLKKLGLSDKYQKTTVHAIRKLYATERMQELRGQKQGDPATNEPERKAWLIVQQELGHGSGLRMALYRTYIKD